LPWHWDRCKIVALERSRAQRLAEAGFQVRRDGRGQSLAPGFRSPFTAEELARVSDQFDEVTRGPLTYARRPLTVEEVVRVLRWTRCSPSVADLVEVPNPFVGRFSHIEEGVVHDRAAQIVYRNVPSARVLEAS
jgi:hypothetical protein